MSPSAVDLFGADPDEKWTVSGTAGPLASSFRSHATSAEAAASATKLFPDAAITVEARRENTDG